MTVLKPLAESFLVAVLACSGCRPSDGTSQPGDGEIGGSTSVSAARSDVVAIDTASFAGPEGWISIPPDKPKLKGWFISPDSKRNDPRLMIMVDVGKPTHPDVATAAQDLAKKWGGRVLEEEVLLDGAPSTRIRVDAAAAGLQPIEAILCLRSDRLYLLMGGAKPGYSVVDAVEAVRASWKWR